MKTILIDAERSAYSPRSVDETMTLDELIDFLTRLKTCEEIDGDTPVYLRHDSGYTFGGITESCFAGGKGENGSKIIDLGELAYYTDEEKEGEEE